MKTEASPSPLTILGLFAKHWTPGLVKTRLATGCGERIAAEVHRLMLAFMTDRLSSFDGARTVLFWPLGSRHDFEQLVGKRWSLEVQSAGDLGERLSAFFRCLSEVAAANSESAERQASMCIAVGADCVEITTETIQAAEQALKSCDVVIGPAEDGGYYLLGMRRFLPQLFQGIEWGSPDVLNSTLEAARRLGAEVSLLETKRDIDTLEDLEAVMFDLFNHDEPALRSLAERMKLVVKGAP